MKMVDADFVTEDEYEIRRVLQECPLVAARFTRLLNGYHELVNLCMEMMEAHSVDTADVARSHAKKENEMRRLGFSVKD